MSPTSPAPPGARVTTPWSRAKERGKEGRETSRRKGSTQPQNVTGMHRTKRKGCPGQHKDVTRKTKSTHPCLRSGIRSNSHRPSLRGPELPPVPCFQTGELSWYTSVPEAHPTCTNSPTTQLICFGFIPAPVLASLTLTTALYLAPNGRSNPPPLACPSGHLPV